MGIIKNMNIKKIFIIIFVLFSIATTVFAYNYYSGNGFFIDTFNDSSGIDSKDDELIVSNNINFPTDIKQAILASDADLKSGDYSTQDSYIDSGIRISENIIPQDITSSLNIGPIAGHTCVNNGIISWSGTDLTYLWYGFLISGGVTNTSYKDWGTVHPYIFDNFNDVYGYGYNPNKPSIPTPFPPVNRYAYYNGALNNNFGGAGTNNILWNYTDRRLVWLFTYYTFGGINGSGLKQTISMADGTAACVAGSQWEATYSIPVLKRYGHSMVEINRSTPTTDGNGYVDSIIFGGYDGTSYSKSLIKVRTWGGYWYNNQYKIEKLDESSNFPYSGRYFHSAVWTGTEMLVFGGYDGTGYVNELWSYNPVNPSATQWTNIYTNDPSATNRPKPRFGHKAIWSNGKMYTFGGYNNTDGYFNDLWAYDPSVASLDKRWQQISLNPAPAARAFHSLNYSERSPSGKYMLLLGGYNGPITSHPVSPQELINNGSNVLDSAIFLKWNLPTIGTYTSKLFDCEKKVTIKKLSWYQSLPTGTSVKIYVFSGNSPTSLTKSAAYSSTSSGNVFALVTDVANKRYFRLLVELQSSNDGNNKPSVSSITTDYYKSELSATSIAVTPQPNLSAGTCYWDKISFSGTLGTGDILTVQALTSNGSAISGKSTSLTSTGTKTIDLSSLKVADYPSLELKVTFTKGNSTFTPSLNQWSLSWAQANAGEDKITTANSEVVFNASGSIGNATNYGGEGLQYRWDFEGNNAWTTWSTNPSSKHTYTSLKTYTAKLQISRDGVNVLSEDTVNVNVVANFSFTNNGSQINISKSGYGLVSTFEAFSTSGSDTFTQINVPVISNITDIDKMEVWIKDGGRVGGSSAIGSGLVMIPVGNQSLKSDPQVTYELRTYVKGDATSGHIIEFDTIGPYNITSNLVSKCIVSTSPQLSNINVVKNNPNITIEATAISGSTVYMDGSSPYFPLLKFRGYTNGPLSSMTMIKAIRPYDMGNNLNANDVSSIEVVEMVPGINTYSAFVSSYSTGNYVSLGESTGFDGVNPATIMFGDKKPVFSGSVEKEYFLVAHIASTATPGEKVGVTLNPSNSVWKDNVFYFDDIGALLTPASGDLLPQKSVEINISKVDVNVIPTDTAVATVYQGVKNLKIINFDVATVQGDTSNPWKNLLLKSIKVTKEETLTSGTSGADKVTLQYDKTGTGTVWENVGSGEFVGSNAIINTDFSAIEAAIYPYINKATKKFRILVNINSTAIGTIKFTIKGSEFTYTTNVNTVKTSFIGCTSSEQFTTKNITIQLAINKVSIDEVKDVGQAAIEQDKELVVMGLVLRKTDTNPGGGAFNSLTIWPNNASGQSTYDLSDVEYKVYRIDTYDDYRGDSINDKCHAISNAYKFADRSNPQTIILNESQTIDDTYYYFVTAKVNRLAKFESTPELIDSKLRVSILNKGAVGLADNNDQVETSLSFPRTLSDIRITDRPDTMTVSPVKISNTETEARQGKKFAIAKLNLRTDEDYALWKSLTIQKGGSLPTNLITCAALYLDTDNDGVFNETKDQQLAQTSTFTGISATIGFNNYEMVTDKTGSKTYFVVLGIDNSRDTVGKTISLSIAANTSIAVLGIDNVTLEQTPFISDEFTVVERYVPTRPVVKNLDYNYYTADFQKLVFEWDSSAEEGISEVRYLLSKTKVDDAKTIINWTVLSKTADPTVASGKETVTVKDILGSNLDQNQMYYLYVQTVSEVEGVKYESLFAAEHTIKADITPPSKISKPMIFTDTSNSQTNSGSVTTSGFYTVHWDPSFDPETEIINYQVQERDNENAAWRTVLLDEPNNINFNIQHGTYTINIDKTDPFKTYYYRVRSQNAAGLWSDWSDESVNVVVGAVSSVIAGDPTNYPNPFDSRNGSTKINFSVGAIGNFDGDIKIFDMFGRLVKKINFNGVGPITKEIEWNGENGAGTKVSKGVYIAAITVNADSGKSEKKIRKVGVIH